MSSQRVVPGPPAWYDFEGKRFHRDREGYYWSDDGSRLHIPDGIPWARPAVPAGEADLAADKAATEPATGGSLSGENIATIGE